jgi:hypothetical protein
VPQLALTVSWTQRPRSLRLSFGVLVLERPLIVLRDRTGAELFAEDARALAAAPFKSAMVELTPPKGGPFYVTGFTGQQRRDRVAQELAERHHAVGLPSRSRRERQALERTWQPAVLDLLAACGAAVGRADSSEGVRPARAKPSADG